MEISLMKHDLIKVLSKADRAIQSNVVTPILAGMLLVADGDMLKITGSNSEFSIITMLKNTDDEHYINIISDGSVVLPAKQLVGIAKSMPDGEVHIRVGENHQTTITGGKKGSSKFVLNGMNAEEYPRLPNFNKGVKFSANGNELSEGFKKTVFAVLQRDTRPVLTGVNVSIGSNGTLTFIATDAHRLSKVNSIAFETENDLGNDFNLTIPEKTSKEIIRFLKNNGKVDITIIKEKQVVFQTGSEIIYSRLISGQYPDTKNLIPTNHITEVFASRDGLLSAIERASILNDDENKAVTLRVNKEQEHIFKTVTLIQKKNELGQSKEDVVVEDITGEEQEVSFNASYMIDALKHINDDKVIIRFGGRFKPFTVVGNETQNELVQLILPIR